MLVALQPIVAALKTVVPNETEIAWFIGKFNPVTWSVVAKPATTPEVGDTVTEDTVVVRLAVAVLKYPSVAEITWVPGRKTGMTKVAIIAPPGKDAPVIGTVMLSMVNDVKLV